MILLLNDCKFEHSILAKYDIQICWQSRGRGRAQRGPRPLAWDELGCIKFQLITRGAFRFHARPGLQANAFAADLSDTRCHDVCVPGGDGRLEIVYFFHPVEEVCWPYRKF